MDKRSAANKQDGSVQQAIPQVRCLSDVLGAEIEGVDLATPISAKLKELIVAAIVERHMVVFRGQRLAPDQQYRLAHCFGEIQTYVTRQRDGSRLPPMHLISNLDAQGRPSASAQIHANYFWHSDKSNAAEPALFTILHALELPVQGGDTQFADMTAAYEALPEAFKTRINDLRVIHSLAAIQRNIGGPSYPDEAILESPPVSHPLVRVHRDTRRKSLYIGMTSSHVAGLDEEEGRQLLAELLSHATQPRFVLTHRWRPGDLVMWDNRCLLHRSVANYDRDRYRRILRRTVIKGSVP
jgi:alpha-ketoglutarate-dependent taurine dioxygenase